VLRHAACLVSVSVQVVECETGMLVVVRSILGQVKIVLDESD